MKRVSLRVILSEVTGRLCFSSRSCGMSGHEVEGSLFGSQWHRHSCLCSDDLTFTRFDSVIGRMLA